MSITPWFGAHNPLGQETPTVFSAPFRALFLRVFVFLLLASVVLVLPDFGQQTKAPDTQKSLQERATEGEAGAQFLLGVMYEQGQAVPHDYAEAVRWYRKAADQGDATAQYNLGVTYANGQGVPQDYVQAHLWVNLAALRATPDEQKLYAGRRDKIAALMTPAQLTEAQRLAREWKPKKWRK